MILASSSPRRKALLIQAGFEPIIEPADVDEAPLPAERPTDLVRRLATLKARTCLDARVALDPTEVILAADTIVWLGDEVLGKPLDAADAARMLRVLSGKTHHVSTGVCLILGTADGVTESSFVDTTAVTFKTLSDEEIMRYVATAEPLDKAGAYGIQGQAREFVKRLDGDYNNVVGLPVSRVLKALAARDESAIREHIS